MTREALASLDFTRGKVENRWRGQSVGAVDNPGPEPATGPAAGWRAAVKSGAGALKFIVESDGRIVAPLRFAHVLD